MCEAWSPSRPRPPRPPTSLPHFTRCNAGFLVTVQVQGTRAQSLKDIGGLYANVYALPP
jgi:hypothetical protein